MKMILLLLELHTHTHECMVHIIAYIPNILESDKPNISQQEYPYYPFIITGAWGKM